MFSDKIWVEITSADIARTMNELNAMNIDIHHIRKSGDISALLMIAAKDHPLVVNKMEKDGNKAVCKGRQGLQYRIKLFLTRPILIIGIALLLILSMWLPTRVLFIQTIGNDQIPDKLLLQKAEECGLRFGVPRRAVRSEEIKNQLLAKIPQLQWAGINTSGCVATISVHEKDIATEDPVEDGTVSSIVALTDGIITQCIVRKGNRLCSVGQAVKTGQLLVSGYVDCGIVTQATQADAEIIAETLHKMRVVSPSEYSVRDKYISSTAKYSLQVGKKLINFFKDSGISDATCVKMYEKKYLMLPGGHSLPIALIVERQVTFETGSQTVAPIDAETLLHTYSTRYLSDHMIAGSVLASDTDFEHSNGVYALKGVYICREMIGQIKHEESLILNGKNN